MAQHTLTTIAADQATWSNGAGAYFLQFNNGGHAVGVPAAYDASNVANGVGGQVQGIVFGDDSVIPVGSTINSIVLQVTQKTNTSNAFKPTVGYQSQNETDEDKTRSYDGHSGDFVPTTYTQWLMTETEDGRFFPPIPFTRSALFAIRFHLNCGRQTTDPPDPPTLYFAQVPSLLVDYTPPGTTTISITGSGGVTTNGSATITRTVNNAPSNAVVVSGGGGAAYPTGTGGTGGISGGGVTAISMVAAGGAPELHGSQWGLHRVDLHVRDEETA